MPFTSGAAATNEGKSGLPIGALKRVDSASSDAFSSDSLANSSTAVSSDEEEDASPVKRQLEKHRFKPKIEASPCLASPICDDRLRQQQLDEAKLVKTKPRGSSKQAVKPDERAENPTRPVATHGILPCNGAACHAWKVMTANGFLRRYACLNAGCSVEVKELRDPGGPWRAASASAKATSPPIPGPPTVVKPKIVSSTSVSSLGNLKPMHPVATGAIPVCKMGYEHEWTVRANASAVRQYRCRECSIKVKEKRVSDTWIPFAIECPQ